jgi:crotonobetainyl-CoA:carnitine CoA-transferase CaiB-like acyl-CoA transferase
MHVCLPGSLLAGLVNQASAYLNAGVVAGRMGNAHPSIAPYETLRAADRPIALAVGNDTQFARLATVVGGAALERRLATRPAAEWVAELTAAGVPCGVVNSIARRHRDSASTRPRSWPTCPRRRRQGQRSILHR